MLVRCLVAWLLLHLTPAPISAASDVILNGAGATFPYPLYQKWIDAFQARNESRVSYQPLGSSGGIRQLLRRSVDFGGTDAFLTDEELEKAPAEILHIPTCIGAVVLTYNLPGTPELRLTPKVIGDIFSKRITRWSDPAISQVNPAIELPADEIVVVHRSDGSGTTFLFTDYLSKVYPRWKEEVGRDKIVSWPAGLGVEGNRGVADMVGRISGSIGYMELAYAKSRHLPVAVVRNKSGRFVYPSLESVSAAAQVDLPWDTRILLTDTPAAEGYPISAFTYLIFYREQAYGRRTRQRARALFGFLWWVTHEGQSYNREFLYSPLPEEAARRAEEVLRRITFQEAPLADE